MSRCLQREFLRISLFAERAPLSVALFAVRVLANLTVCSESSSECRVVCSKVPVSVALFAARVFLLVYVCMYVCMYVCVALFSGNKT